MSLAVMKLALEALEGVVSAHNYEGGTPVKAITALRLAIERAERPQTHSEECWRWHHQCAVARIEQAEQTQVANNWSVFNLGAEVASGMSLADAVAELTPQRMERGWSAVCVLNKDNPPLYTAPPRQPEQKQPVAWMYVNTDGECEQIEYIKDEPIPDDPSVTVLYTAPPQRKPLTDEEIYAAIKNVDSLKAIEVARAVEAAHGIKGEV